MEFKTNATERHIIAGLFMSLDGVVEAPDQWHFPYVNEEMGAALGSMQAHADTLLLGRATYESFAKVWPQRTGDMADGINNIAKLVASNTLDEAEWNNSTVIRGDVLTQLAELKKQPGKDITISGSISLTQSLLRAGLVDQLHLLIHPIVLGSGQRFFDGDQKLSLELVQSTTFTTGVVHLQYQPA